jgi:hypothetical protein
VRDGALVILVVGDEGVPTVVGKTAAVIEEVTCVRDQYSINENKSMSYVHQGEGKARTI